MRAHIILAAYNKLFFFPSDCTRLEHRFHFTDVAMIWVSKPVSVIEPSIALFKNIFFFLDKLLAILLPIRESRFRISTWKSVGMTLGFDGFPLFPPGKCWVTFQIGHDRYIYILFSPAFTVILPVYGWKAMLWHSNWAAKFHDGPWRLWNSNRELLSFSPLFLSQFLIHRNPKMHHCSRNCL